MVVCPKPEKRAPKPRKYIARGPAPRRRTSVKKLRTTERAVQSRRDDAWWRRVVRGLADGMCERSGRPGEHAHHIWPKGSHPKLRHEVFNGIYLTHEEHDRAHADMDAFRAWFAGRFPERWMEPEAARLA